MSTTINESSKTVYKFYAPFRPLNKRIREKDLERARKFLNDFVRQNFGGATIYPSEGVEKEDEEGKVFEIIADENELTQVRVEQLRLLILEILTKIKTPYGLGPEREVWSIKQLKVTLTRLVNLEQGR